MQPPPHPSAGWQMPPPIQRTDAKAVAALVLGIPGLLLGACWVGMPLGVAAIVFGVLSHRDIRRANGMVGGAGLATSGIVLGTLGSLLFAGQLCFMLFGILSSHETATAPPPPIAGAPPTPTALTTPVGGWGTVHVVDLHASGGALRSQLVTENASAKSAGEIVLVQTVTASCVACGEIARSVPDPAVQAALANVRLVHVDVDEFRAELPALRMNEERAPWFYVLDATGTPRDGMSADEWDDNDASEIAPVLGAFVHGKLKTRRKAWRAGTTTL